MASEGAVYGTLVAVIVIGLALIVYGMWLSGGQSMNPPATAGGVIVLASISVITIRVATLEEPEHTE